MGQRPRGRAARVLAVVRRRELEREVYEARAHLRRGGPRGAIEVPGLLSQQSSNSEKFDKFCQRLSKCLLDFGCIGTDTAEILRNPPKQPKYSARGVSSHEDRKRRKAEMKTPRRESKVNLRCGCEKIN